MIHTQTFLDLIRLYDMSIGQVLDGDVLATGDDINLPLVRPSKIFVPIAYPVLTVRLSG